MNRIKYQGPPTEWHQTSFGDPLKDVVLGYTVRGNPIELWGDYGVTCCGEATTNGSGYALLAYVKVRELTPPGAAWFAGWAIWLTTRPIYRG